MLVSTSTFQFDLNEPFLPELDGTYQSSTLTHAPDVPESSNSSTTDQTSTLSGIDLNLEQSDPEPTEYIPTELKDEYTPVVGMIDEYTPVMGIMLGLVLQRKEGIPKQPRHFEKF